MSHKRWFFAALIGFLLITVSEFPEDTAMHEVLEWSGHVLVLIGALGRIYCSLFIGGRKNDELVQVGPYSIVRNPLYVFSFIITLGIGLQSTSLVVTAILFVVYVLYYPMVIAKEEAFLEHKFGDAYRSYKKRIHAWWPRFSRWKQPEMIETKPKFVLRTMLDALVFFIPFPLFELISGLQEEGVLPVLLHLW